MVKPLRREREKTHYIESQLISSDKALLKITEQLSEKILINIYTHTNPNPLCWRGWPWQGELSATRRPMPVWE
jgi:hypothetical protein